MTTVAVLGASGYSGVELLRILLRHRDVEVVAAMASRQAGQRLDVLYPDLAGRFERVLEPTESARASEADIVFLALPSGESMRLVPELLERGTRIIDLGGDFRLRSAERYEQAYGRRHTAPELLGKAVYGLPELNRTQIAGAALVANPGCYPTSAILALAPALRARLIDPASIVVSSMSGVSGAGRSSTVELSFAEVNENIRAYRVGAHQHQPEITDVLEDAIGLRPTLSFIPHLVPMTRGIYTTVTAQCTSTTTGAEALALYHEAYRGESFVRVKESVPEIRSVRCTNYCDIGVMLDEQTGRLVMLSTIDNMVKGAAGQAVQNMNIMLGLNEEESLAWTPT
jgi:N-acetyl-gamma-glutamyl-phosphate reductase